MSTKSVAVLLSVFALGTGPAVAAESLPAKTLSEFLSQSEIVAVGVVNDVQPSERGWFEISLVMLEPLVREYSEAELTVLSRDGKLDPGQRILLRQLPGRPGGSYWKTEGAISRDAERHLRSLISLQSSGIDRLRYFFRYLQHADRQVAANAHLEFSLASDDAFTALCKDLDTKEIRALLQIADLPDDRRRLYFAMLAECGDETDAEFVRTQFLQSSDAATPLDAALAAYLNLQGPRGLDFVERHYLANPELELIHIYRAMLAIQCVSSGKESGILIERLQQSFRLVLDHPRLADLAINELAMLGDWSVVDRVASIGRQADEQHVRTAAINYLRRCPSDEAKAQLERLSTDFPKAFRRAKMFFPDSLLVRATNRKAKPIRPLGRGSTGFGC